MLCNTTAPMSLRSTLLLAAPLGLLLSFLAGQLSLSTTAAVVLLLLAVWTTTFLRGVLSRSLVGLPREPSPLEDWTALHAEDAFDPECPIFDAGHCFFHPMHPKPTVVKARPFGGGTTPSCSDGGPNGSSSSFAGTKGPPTARWVRRVFSHVKPAVMNKLLNAGEDSTKQGSEFARAFGERSPFSASYMGAQFVRDARNGGGKKAHVLLGSVGVESGWWDDGGRDWRDPQLERSRKKATSSSTPAATGVDQQDVDKHDIKPGNPDDISMRPFPEALMMREQYHKHGSRIGQAVVAHADLCLGAAVEPVLAVYAELGYVKAIRDNLFFEPDLFPIMSASCAGGMIMPGGDPGGGARGDEQSSSLQHMRWSKAYSPQFRAGFALLEKYGFLYETSLLSPNLDAFHDLAKAFPNQKMLLNILPSSKNFWKSSLQRIGRLPNVHCKIAGMGSTFGGFGFDRRPPRHAPPTSDELVTAMVVPSSCSV